MLRLENLAVKLITTPAHAAAQLQPAAAAAAVVQSYESYLSQAARDRAAAQARGGRRGRVAPFAAPPPWTWRAIY